MILHRTVSGDTSENGVSSRVEACRKRLRLIRGNQKVPILAAEPAGTLVASTEMSQRLEVIKTRPERTDEAGIT